MSFEDRGGPFFYNKDNPLPIFLNPPETPDDELIPHPEKQVAIVYRTLTGMSRESVITLLLKCTPSIQILITCISLSAKRSFMGKC